MQNTKDSARRIVATTAIAVGIFAGYVGCNTEYNTVKIMRTADSVTYTNHYRIDSGTGIIKIIRNSDDQNCLASSYPETGNIPATGISRTEFDRLMRQLDKQIEKTEAACRYDKDEEKVLEINQHRILPV